MAIKLSDHFTYGRLVRFALPSIAMMIFTSIYSVVDGLFVSNFAGKEALAAVNLVFPLAMGLGSVGFMLGTGGAALVAKTMGEGEAVRANRLFSFIALAAVASGILLAAVGAVVLESVLAALGEKTDAPGVELIGRLEAVTGVKAPEQLASLAGREVRFDGCTRPEGMPGVVGAFLG